MCTLLFYLYPSWSLNCTLRIWDHQLHKILYHFYHTWPLPLAESSAQKRCKLFFLQKQHISSFNLLPLTQHQMVLLHLLFEKKKKKKRKIANNQHHLLSLQTLFSMLFSSRAILARHATDENCRRHTDRL